MSTHSGDNYLGLLNNISSVVTNSETLEDALQPVLRLVCNATGWSIGHALTASTDGALQSTLWYADSSYPKQHFEQFRQATDTARASGTTALPDRVFVDGLPKWITGFPSGGNRFPQQSPAARAQLSSGFAFPLRLENKIVGVLAFYSTKAQSPDPELLKVMQEIETTLGHVVQRQTVREQSIGDAKRAWQIIDHAGEAFIAMDDDGRITSWNRSAANLFGWSRDKAIGRRVSDTIIPTRLRDAHEHGVQRYLQDHASKVIGQPVELPALHRDGHEFPIELTRWSLEGAAGTSFYAFLRDTSERQQHEQELKQQGYQERELEQAADYDDLTGLPNKGMLMDHLRQALATRNDPGQRVTVFVIDLDNFKRINSYMGRSVGDQVVVAVTRKLQAMIQPTDTVARLPEDTYALVCPSIQTQNDTIVVARQLLETLQEPLSINSYSVRLSASIGVALSVGEDHEESLFSAANAAVYTAKHAGGGRYEISANREPSDSAADASTARQLKQAIKNNELRLFFDPVVGAGDEKVVAVETQLRWLHPEQGLLHPAEFWPLAEESGLTMPLTEWILDEAYRCSLILEEKHHGDTTLRIVLNQSGISLEQPQLVTMFERIHKLLHNNATQIQFGLEITEVQTMHNLEAANRTIDQLRAMDVKVYLDDFGTRYSTLSHLKRLPLDSLKIEKSFIEDILSSPADYTITKSMIDLAHSLDMLAVAQGVKTREQADTLHKAGIDRMQGPLYAEPRPLDELTQLSFF